MSRLRICGWVMAFCAAVDGGLALTCFERGEYGLAATLLVLAVWCAYWFGVYSDADKNAAR